MMTLNLVEKNVEMQIALKQLTTHLFSKYLLSVYHVSSAVLRAVNRATDKRDTHP